MYKCLALFLMTFRPAQSRRSTGRGTGSHRGHSHVCPYCQQEFHYRANFAHHITREHPRSELAHSLGAQGDGLATDASSQCMESSSTEQIESSHGVEPASSPQRDSEPDSEVPCAGIFDHSTLNVGTSVTAEVDEMLRYVDEKCATILQAISPATAVLYPPLMQFESSLAMHEECAK